MFTSHPVESSYPFIKWAGGNPVKTSYPFIKWAGGKTQLLAELHRVIPSEFDRYFEPFLGGAALFFHLISIRKQRFSPYLSDLNNELIITYRIVKDNVSELLQLLKRYEAAYKSASSEFYYELRDKLEPNNDIEKAARFITLNETCYNGLYRVNRSGIFNVPIGRYKNPLICDSNNLQNVSRALRFSKARILASDYRRIVLENAQKGDFVYLDPPYNPTNLTSNFTSYTEFGYDDDEQEQLASIFKKLDERQCMVLLSNSDTPFIRELYSDFMMYTKEVKVLRAVNCRGSKRAGHKELLIRNYTENA